jgi:hypothetical protein
MLERKRLDTEEAIRRIEEQIDQDIRELSPMMVQMNAMLPNPDYPDTCKRLRAAGEVKIQRLRQQLEQEEQRLRAIERKKAQEELASRATKTQHK